MTKNKSKSSVPNGKINRFSTAGKTAAKIAGKQALHTVKQPFRSKINKDAKKKDHHQEIAMAIFKTLATLKGTALKAAQLLSLEFDLLPPEYQKELKKACYQVPPLNRALVRKVVQNQLGTSPEQVFKQFDATAFAAASIGQVHKAQTQEGDPLAVKIQYPGIDQTIRHDIGLLKLLLVKSPIAGLSGKKRL